MFTGDFLFGLNHWMQILDRDNLELIATVNFAVAMI